MELHYTKNNNTKLFQDFANSDFKIHNLQNYIPLYDTFFTLTKNNANSINLNHKYRLQHISKILTYNTCRAKIVDVCDNILENDIFFKFSPLLDPIKYMVGKYDISDASLLNLPLFDTQNSPLKVHDNNNSSYTDGFFYFLSSKLLHHHGFIHGTDFYGAFLGTKQEFMVNIYDELDYLQESKFFCKNKNHLFKLDNTYYDEYFDNYTKNNREKISIQDIILDISNNNNNSNNNNMTTTIIDLKDIKGIQDISFIDTVFQSSCKTSDYQELELCYTGNISPSKTNTKSGSYTSSTSSSCSSGTSNTRSSESLSDESTESCSDNTSTSDKSYSTATEDTVHATLHNFPVEIIAIEKCENTLDNYLLHNDIRDDELGAIIMQILMMLITFQKVFHMTHNDLHTNNIMYVSTKKEFLYYKFNNKFYKIPTYGKIYKIIDFGRAIYHYLGKRICSDSFHKDGDGATQYNCEPYYNNKKPVIEPNYSFDLCRLSCSLFDFFVDEIEDYNKIKSPIIKIILDWCLDDESRNILYKSNGKERYPDFKLYKMIARTVHNHVPAKVLENEYFAKYVVYKKKISKNKPIMNIDTFPDYS